MIGVFKRWRATRAVFEAARLVEVGHINEAVARCHHALKLDAQCGPAYNELAFIYGHEKKDFEAAAEFARKAVECDPTNPKFHNSVTGVLMDQARQYDSQAEVHQALAGKLTGLAEQIAKHPDYPGLYLSKANFLAMTGHPAAAWEDVLGIAEDLYRKQGRPLPDIRFIIDTVHRRCQDLNAWWQSLSE